MEKIGNINMYGESGTAKLTGDITKTLTQVSSGLTDSLGIDLKTVLGSMFGAHLAGLEKKPAQVPAEVAKNDPTVPATPAQATPVESPVQMSESDIEQAAAAFLRKRKH